MSATPLPTETLPAWRQPARAVDAQDSTLCSPSALLHGPLTAPWTAPLALPVPDGDLNEIFLTPHPEALLCEVHQCVRLPASVLIVYGGHDFAGTVFYEAKARFFPHSWHRVRGTATRWDSSPKRLEVRYCPRCRRAAQLWCAHHSTRAA